MVSEQTFSVVFTLTGITPDPSIQPATISINDERHDYSIGGTNFALDIILPFQQRLSFYIGIFNDDISEGMEGFQITFTPQEHTPHFNEPDVLSPSTFIIIQDDDRKLIF